MKQLTITGMDGVVVAQFLVDVEGKNLSNTFTLPLFLPIVNISLLDIDKKETKRIREITHRVRAMVTPNE